MINELTPEQTAQLPAAVEKWLAIGLCTDPTNRVEAEKWIRKAYTLAGEPEPPYVIFLPDPVHTSIAGAMFSSDKEGELDDSIGYRMVKQIEERLGKRPSDKPKPAKKGKKQQQEEGTEPASGPFDAANVTPIILTEVEKATPAEIQAVLIEAIASQMGLPGFKMEITDAEWTTVRERVRDQVWAHIFGQHDANWLAFYDVMQSVLGLKDVVAPLEGLMEAAKHCGWWLPFDGICFVADRPRVLHRDAEHRLHCEDGPALKYENGLAIYAIGGVRVPEQVVMAPETQTIADIEKEDNAEIQRIRIERFGWGRYLDESGAKIVDKRFNERDAQYETLYEMKNGQKRIRLADPSTGREYIRGIPREVETCQDAQNWMAHGLEARCEHRS